MPCLPIAFNTLVEQCSGATFNCPLTWYFTNSLKNAGYEILSAEKTKQASTSVTLENEDDIKFMNLLIEKLEDDDDVMDVYHNWENCDD